MEEKGFDLFQFLTSQAGILASCSIMLNCALGYFIWHILKNFRRDIKEAFSMANTCIRDSHANMMTFQNVLSETTKAVAVLTVQLQPERRGRN